MIRPPPIATRTATPFPYTTLFRSPNRLQIGDFQAEISRFDPFALTLTLGAMIGQTLKEGFQDTNEYGIGQGIETAIQVAWHSGQDSFLGKSYLQSLTNRSEEHTSELQSLMRISYAVFCSTKTLHIQHSLALLIFYPTLYI